MALNGVMGAASFVGFGGAVSQVPSNSVSTNARVDSYSSSPKAEFALDLLVRTAAAAMAGVMTLTSAFYAGIFVIEVREGFLKAPGGKPVAVIIGGMALISFALTGLFGVVAFGPEEWRNRALNASAPAASHQPVFPRLERF